MAARIPAVAGQFYPDSPDGCRRAVEECLAGIQPSEPPPAADLAFRAIGGIAPHAGWICSGAVAGEVIKALAGDGTVETFVVFGAVHRRLGASAVVYEGQAWETPLGEIAVDEELAAASLAASPRIEVDPEAHESEHSIEVEVPFIRYLAPQAKLLPVMVPPTPAAPEVGRILARQAAALGRKVAFLGSTDLTHYGPRYRFTPHGIGAEGLRWAKEVNDRRILDLVVNLKADEVVQEAAINRNACGPGAIAATVAASQEAGATVGRILRHTTSNEVLCDRYGQMEDAVGYAGVVFGVTRS